MKSQAAPERSKTSGYFGVAAPRVPAKALPAQPTREIYCFAASVRLLWLKVCVVSLIAIPGFATVPDAPEGALLASLAAALAWRGLGRADAEGLKLVIDHDRILLVLCDQRPLVCTVHALAWYQSLLFLSLRDESRTRVVILARDALPEREWRRLRFRLRQLEP
ncbi:MAG: protein YgfX [Pseudomonadota bacterium]